MYPATPSLHHSVILLAFVAGCGHESTAPRSDKSGPEAAPSLIAEADREHDFGTVIGRPGQQRVHRYRLINATARDVAITRVVNRKTCCGVVRAGKLVLPPGESTDVEVTLIVGDKFGGVVHETEVVTDDPSEPSLVLRTTADAHAAFRVEEVSTAEKPTLFEGGPPRRVEFRVLATGTAADPPADLNRLELRSTVNAVWVGPQTDGPAEDGLTVVSRPFATDLDAVGPPGERRAEVSFQDGKQVLYRHVLNWEVVSPLAASPKVIVMKPGTRDYRVLIQSRDKASFRVTRVECKVSGVQGRAAKAEAAVTQVVEVEGVPEPGNARGVMTIFTDHPTQTRVDLPFVVLDG